MLQPYLTVEKFAPWSTLSSLPHPSQLSLTQAKALGQAILRKKDWNLVSCEQTKSGNG